MKIRGNTVGTTMPRPDWEQTDPTKADYIVNKPDFSEYVKNTDFATKVGVGVVKVNSNYGIYAMADGTLYTLPASQDVINQKKSTYNPIVPLTLDYAVKNSLTTNTIELTDEEKANACNWLGVTALVGDIETALDSIIAIQNGLMGGVAE